MKKPNDMTNDMYTNGRLGILSSFVFNEMYDNVCMRMSTELDIWCKRKQIGKSGLLMKLLFSHIF